MCKLSGIKSSLSAGSHRQFFCVLFWLFEGLLIASVVVLILNDPRKRMPVSDFAGFLTLASIVCLFVVCFVLRRTVRRLAVFGWFTILGAFLASMAFPVL